MNELSISLLGIVRIAHQGKPTETGMGRAVKRLLGYLTLFRHRFHAREVLAGLFWGESSEDRARSNLSTTLWRLRKVLEPSSIPSGAYLVTTSTGEIGINRKSDPWIDVEFFENQLKTCLAKPYRSLNMKEVSQLEGALNLYKGELLEGIYDDWALHERERLRSLFVNGQIHLLRHYRHHKAWEKGLTCGKNVLSLDPLREEIHREMMRLYFGNGQRALALRQYEKCHEILASELDVLPMEETQILYAQISCRDSGQFLEMNPPVDIVTTNNLLAQFRKNIRDFENATALLRDSVKSLEGTIKGRNLNTDMRGRKPGSLGKDVMEDS